MDISVVLVPTGTSLVAVLATWKLMNQIALVLGSSKNLPASSLRPDSAHAMFVTPQMRWSLRGRVFCWLGGFTPEARRSLAGLAELSPVVQIDFEYPC